MKQCCKTCTKWDTDYLIYPYGRCLDKNTIYSQRCQNSYYLEGSECKYHTTPAPAREGGESE